MICQLCGFIIPDPGPLDRDTYMRFQVEAARHVGRDHPEILAPVLFACQLVVSPVVAFGPWPAAMVSMFEGERERLINEFQNLSHAPAERDNNEDRNSRSTFAEQRICRRNA